ncbi:conserved hypothetical protein; associated to putative secretion protein and putative transporter [Cupriavidus taiwanensis]|uniref:DUF1656 domain-containing protein n=1 Tax=Cupriavidus taiwanensis TaxID=164546 RepID=UPI000E167416|nr:DUF1656 domain-containing protein [Cupriavidus taiwanensis]SPA32370.1 conserved hypothetical protein; associated to putative secretion protein and putative transporter [Cupriavidus taiwanensis]
MHAAEFDLYGVFVPATVVWMLAAFAVTAALRAVLVRVGFYRIVWHRSLFNLSLYILVLGAIVALVWQAPS